MFNSKKKDLTDIQKKNISNFNSLRKKMLLQYLLTFVIYTSIIFALITSGKVLIGIGIGLLSTLGFAITIAIIGELSHKKVKNFLRNEIIPDIEVKENIPIKDFKKIETLVEDFGKVRVNYLVTFMDGREIIASDYYSNIKEIEDNLSEFIKEDKLKEEAYKKALKEKSKKSKGKRKRKNQFNVKPTDNSKLLKGVVPIGFLTVLKYTYDYDVAVGEKNNRDYYGFPEKKEFHTLAFNKKEVI